MKHIKELDGIRALAISSVFIFHGGIPLAGHLHLSWVALRGWVGVDLFFVLSGLLITGILLDSKNRDGYFKSFYTRRALRIWPLYYIWVIFVLILTKYVVIIGSHAHPIPMWQLLLYVQNFNPGLKSIGILSITWSLAVEEQFYFVWPLVVYLTSYRILAAVCMAILIAEPVLRWLAPAMHVHPSMVYLGTPFHIDGLAFGALIAIAYRSKWFMSVTYRVTMWLALLVGTLFVVFLAKPHPDTRFNGPFEFTVVGLMCFGLVGLTLMQKEGLWNRLMKSEVLRVISTVSYCIYLIHILAIKAMENPRLRGKVLHGHTGLVPEITIFTAEIVLVFPAACLSWVLFESKLLALKEQFSFSKKHSLRPIVAGSSAPLDGPVPLRD